MLRITDADPIEHGLLFERFLNPTRREMPDVDIDFCSARRDEVIQFIYERFGHDKVAMVATVNTVRAPSAVRIASRAFGFTPDEVEDGAKAGGVLHGSNALPAAASAGLDQQRKPYLLRGGSQRGIALVLAVITRNGCDAMLRCDATRPQL